MSALVGVDLGTSAVKVLAVDPSGNTLVREAESYPLETPQPEVVEQNPDVVYAATMRVLARLAGTLRDRGDDVVAIGFSAAMHGVACVDENGDPLSHVITWMDRRAHAIAEAWRAEGIAEALYRTTGAPMHAMLPVAKLRWLCEHDPALFHRTRRFVGLKELVVHRWTGEWLVDHGIASATGMLDLRARRWDRAALEWAGVDEARLSPPAPPSTALPLRAQSARELGLRGEARVVLGSSDGALANIGAGASGGDVAVTLGTSGAVRVLIDAPILDLKGRTFCYCADDRRCVLGGATSGAGASLDWIFTLLLADVPHDLRFERAVALAAEIAPGAEGLSVLPFFAGERAPYWNSALRASIEGLDLTHDRRAILRAAFEGVAFGVRSVYDVVRELAGDADRLVLTGGLTKAELVRQLLADVFDVPAVKPHEEEAAALGAALLAGQALGLVADASAVARARGYDPPAMPNSERRAAYADAFARYRASVAAELARLSQARP